MEGLRATAGNYHCDHRIKIIQDMPCGNPHYPNSLPGKPFVANFIAVRPIATLVRLTVDFDSDPARQVREVEHIRTKRVLPAELQAVRPLS